jgi:hypothetical protein
LLFREGVRKKSSGLKTAVDYSRNKFRGMKEMKIHDIPGIRQPQKTRGSSGSAKAKGDFQEVMNQVINRDTLNQPTEASGNHMLAPASVLHVQSAQPFVQGRETDASGKKALREVESALEMAGHYADKLATLM